MDDFGSYDEYEEYFEGDEYYFKPAKTGINNKEEIYNEKESPFY